MAKQIESSLFWVRAISLSLTATALIMSKSFIVISVEVVVGDFGFLKKAVSVGLVFDN